MEFHGVFGRVTILTRLVKAAFLRPRITRSRSHCARLHAANGAGDTADLAADANGGHLPSHVSRTWTLEELDIFYRMRDESATTAQIAEAVGRTASSVFSMRRKAAALPREVLREGLREQRTSVVRPFSPQEDTKMLALLANGNSLRSVSAKLGRYEASVSGRRRRLVEKEAEKHDGPWTAEEIDLLQSWKAEGVSVVSIASRLGRRSHSVAYQLERPKRPRAYSLWRAKAPWTAAEDKLLRDLKAQGLDPAQIHEHMPHRSACSIKLRYYREDMKVFGPTKREWTWTTEESDTLRDLVAQKKTYKDMVAMLGRSAGSISQKMLRDKSIGNVRPSPCRWSEEDMRSMSRMREAGLTWNAIAASLGRTVTSCKQAFGKYTTPPGALPLYRGKTHPIWSVHEIEKLLDMRASQRPYTEIAASLGRSAGACNSAHNRYLAAKSRQARSPGDSKGAPS